MGAGLSDLGFDLLPFLNKRFDLVSHRRRLCV